MVFHDGLKCVEKILRDESADAGTELMAAQDDGQDAVDIHPFQETKQIHGSGFTGEGALGSRFGTIVRADEIGMTGIYLPGLSPEGMGYLRKPFIGHGNRLYMEMF